MTTVRKGQAPAMLGRDEFHLRFRRALYDPAYDDVDDAIDAVEQVAWEAYQEGRKAPRTVKAGPGYADPDFDLSLEWKQAADRLKSAEARQKDPATRSRVLLINGAARNDGTCPGEISKSWRLTMLAKETLDTMDVDSDVLDLSLVVSDYDRHIHPCKACVSTAMPLCNWPCSCYPNHSLRQVNDWMNEIYERWVSAHGIIIVTPTYWYQTPAVLKLMIDRLVCADGGNPDPTLTHGKSPDEAKALELKGWDYPKHLAGRAFGLVVHGDVAGVEGTRRALSDWLGWMGLLNAGTFSQLDRYLGYYESYAESHDVLDRDTKLQEEVRNVARAVAAAVREIRAGRVDIVSHGLKSPRPK